MAKYIDRAFSPIGLSEGKKPKKTQGNATLTTRSESGRTIQTPLWITEINTGLDMQVDKGQLRHKVSIRPLRMQERFVEVSCIFSTYAEVDGRFTHNPRIEGLERKIKHHWAFNLNRNSQVPITLNYFGINKMYRGYINAVKSGATRFKNTVERRLVMQLIKPTNDSPAKVRGKAPFVPTSQDIKTWGNQWYRVNALGEIANPDD